jgi:enamine deaminase RidA (YjgF/YER057c/UK114 family)
MHTIEAMAARYEPLIAASRAHLSRSSGLHPDFVTSCLSAIDKKKSGLQTPLLGELFPQLVTEGLGIRYESRVELGAAWTALYGFIELADKSIDERGHLDGKTAMQASALLGWGIATVGKFTVGTRYADIFVNNVTQAFAGQYDDVLHRADPGFDRSRSATDKNRAVVAMVAGYCAAAGLESDCLIQATEHMLGALQTLDDMRDVRQDHSENNLTAFVRMLVATASAPIEQLSDRQLYTLLAGNQQFVDELRGVVATIEKIITLLDPAVGSGPISYLVHLRGQVQAVVTAIGEWQKSPTVEDPDFYGRIREISASS